MAPSSSACGLVLVVAGGAVIASIRQEETKEAVEDVQVEWRFASARSGFARVEGRGSGGVSFPLPAGWSVSRCACGRPGDWCRVLQCSYVARKPSPPSRRCLNRVSSFRGKGNRDGDVVADGLSSRVISLWYTAISVVCTNGRREPLKAGRTKTRYSDGNRMTSKGYNRPSD